MSFPKGGIQRIVVAFVERVLGEKKFICEWHGFIQETLESIEMIRFMQKISYLQHLENSDRVSCHLECLRI